MLEASINVANRRWHAEIQLNYVYKGRQIWSRVALHTGEQWRNEDSCILRVLIICFWCWGLIHTKGVQYQGWSLSFKHHKNGKTIHDNKISADQVWSTLKTFWCCHSCSVPTQQGHPSVCTYFHIVSNAYFARNRCILVMCITFAWSVLWNFLCNKAFTLSQSWTLNNNRCYSLSNI